MLLRRSGTPAPHSGPAYRWLTTRTPSILQISASRWLTAASASTNGIRSGTVPQTTTFRRTSSVPTIDRLRGRHAVSLVARSPGEILPGFGVHQTDRPDN